MQLTYPKLGEDRIVSAFGPHLLLEGYGCDPMALACQDTVRLYLEQAPDRLGMTAVMPPYVMEYHGRVPEDWGITGFVIIAESHIAVHTFPSKRFMTLDIFSCKEFDEIAAILGAGAVFGFDRYEHKLLDRGLEFPRALKPVADHLLREREGMEANQGKGGPGG